jgi:Na+-driven multidrug efflux pump
LHLSLFHWSLLLIQSITAYPSLRVRLFGDRSYYAALVTIALPIALQNLITSSLGMVSMVFIGQLGDDTVAALGLANQAFFLLNLALFGVFSGTAMFTAQLWGKRNLIGIHKVLGISLGLALVIYAFLPPLISSSRLPCALLLSCAVLGRCACRSPSASSP